MKKLVAALAALFALASFTGCPRGDEILDGMGTITIRVGSADPGRAVLTNNELDQFRYVFTFTGLNETFTRELAPGVRVLTVTVVVGTWRIAADAYLGDIRSGAGAKTFTISRESSLVTIPLSGTVITSFTITTPAETLAGQVDYQTNTITLPAPAGWEPVTGLSPDITHTGETIDPTPLTQQDFSVPVTYTVTASDGSKEIYTVIVIPPGTWFVSDIGSDSNDGKTPLAPLATMRAALGLIWTAYNTTPWPLGQNATIIVTGTINGTDALLSVGGTGSPAYPPILLKGSSPGAPGVLDAAGNGPVLYINNGNTVTLDADLTLQGGSGVDLGGGAFYGGGVFVSGTGSAFTMQNGTISGNTVNYGGGVFVATDGAFTMDGGTISSNAANTKGGGVYVASGSVFTMQGGTVSGNTVLNLDGGGVYVNSATFTMDGGTISGNTAINKGGGVYAASGSSFTKSDFTITGMPGGGVTGMDVGAIANGVSSGSGNGHAVWDPGRTSGPTFEDNTLFPNNTW